MENKDIIIKCPECGYEYTVSEIFFPDDLVPSSRNVIRDEKGKIVFVDGDDFNLEQEFTCDRCSCTFKAKAKISFETELVSKDDFDEDYTSKIK